MKYCQLILLICMIASCHSTPKVTPKAGEIWRSKADIPDVRIDSVTGGMVHYTLLGDHPQCLDTCSEAITSFMQSCHKVGEVKPDRP